MTEEWLATRLPAWVEAGWGQRVRSVEPTDAGMNSATAVVELDTGRFVAKWVPATQAAALASGSAVARRVARSGVSTGEPLLTDRGQVTVPAPPGALALLHLVPGRPLTDAAVDQVSMALTLARVHAVGPATRQAPYQADLLELVHDVEDWVRPAVAAALDEQAGLPPLTWGTVHGDPVPDAFRHDAATDRTGLVDWTGAGPGPVLYDVASAVMYLGGPARAGAFLATYREHGPAPAAELDEHLAAFHRLRGAVQAAYFSMRIAGADLTGIASQQENWKGLRDAGRMLAAHGRHRAPGGS